MKRMILILLFCFCQYAYCNVDPFWSGHKGINGILQTTNDSEPIGRVTLSIPSPRRKRDTGESAWHIFIPFSDGTIKNLSLTPTDGLLIKMDTPMWQARRENDSDEIIYTPVSMPKEFGRMDFYHDFAQKAAIVVYHDQQRIEGFVERYKFELETDDLTDDDDPEKRYLLVPQPQSVNSHIISIPVEKKPESDSFPQELPKDQELTIAYPQLLIQFDEEDVRIDWIAALRKMITYWNGVDMLYSVFVQPQIQLNIAGLILPMDNNSAPWIKMIKSEDGDEYTDATATLYRMADHWERYKRIFSLDNHDVMVSFTRYKIDDSGRSKVTGSTVVNASCRTYQTVSIIRNEYDTYDTGAHELAHTFSAYHDEHRPNDAELPCQNFTGIMSWKWGGSLEWSPCDWKDIQEYFNYSNSDSRCYWNHPGIKFNHSDVPTPVPTDVPVEIPIEVTEPVTEAVTEQVTESVEEDIPAGPHCFSRFYFPEEICQNATSLSYEGENKLCKDLICSSKHDLETKESITLTQILDGLSCEHDQEEILSACYHGECRPIDDTKIRKDSLKCLVLEEEET